jgi:hypothetical protein
LYVRRGRCLVGTAGGGRQEDSQMIHPTPNCVAVDISVELVHSVPTHNEFFGPCGEPLDVDSQREIDL